MQHLDGGTKPRSPARFAEFRRSLGRRGAFLLRESWRRLGAGGNAARRPPAPRPGRYRAVDPAATVRATRTATCERTRRAPGVQAVRAARQHRRPGGRRGHRYRVRRPRDRVLHQCHQPGAGSRRWERRRPTAGLLDPGLDRRAGGGDVRRPRRAAHGGVRLHRHRRHRLLRRRRAGAHDDRTLDDAGRVGGCRTRRGRRRAADRDPRPAARARGPPPAGRRPRAILRRPAPGSALSPPAPAWAPAPSPPRSCDVSAPRASRRSEDPSVPRPAAAPDEAP